MIYLFQISFQLITEM